VLILIETLDEIGKAILESTRVRIGKLCTEPRIKGSLSTGFLSLLNVKSKRPDSRPDNSPVQAYDGDVQSRFA
jgi:hypothetical protein